MKINPMNLLLLVGLCAIAFYGWKLTSRGAYESAAYQVVEADGSFELREYPPLMMATTPMRFAAQGEDGSFMRLFRYISGDNAEKQKVAMTVPVFMQTEDSTRGGVMGFVMPRKTAERKVPEPLNENVLIREREAGRFAVLRFSGRLNDASQQRAERRLQDWIAARRLETQGTAEFAGYDPPWTPGPLRRNEVLIRLR